MSVDILALIYWALFNGKAADRPTPIERPGHRPRSETFGAATTVDELKRIYGSDFDK